jgi:ketosteroid isomerase-like protein
VGCRRVENLDRRLRLARGLSVGKKLGELEPEVGSDLLETLQRDASLTVLERRERRGRHPDLAGLLTQAEPGLDAQPPDALPDDLPEAIGVSSPLVGDLSAQRVRRGEVFGAAERTSLPRAEQPGLGGSRHGILPAMASPAELLSAWRDALLSRDADAFARLFAADAVFLDVEHRTPDLRRAREIRGREAIADLTRAWVAETPRFDYDLLDVLAGEMQAATRWRYATAEVDVEGVTWIWCRNGEISRALVLFDSHAFLHDAGLLARPAANE